jgi:hypothetical protein
MPSVDGVDVVGLPCELCKHCYAQAHRLNPGCWGGRYEDKNVVWLCPNHHQAIHFLMSWYYCESPRGPVFEPKAEEHRLFLEKRFDAYHTDGPLLQLWLSVVKPIVKDRLIAEGRYHPYQRTLPDEPRFAVPRG